MKNLQTIINETNGQLNNLADAVIFHPELMDD